MNQFHFGVPRGSQSEKGPLSKSEPDWDRGLRSLGEQLSKRIIQTGNKRDLSHPGPVDRRIVRAINKKIDIAEIFDFSAM